MTTMLTIALVLCVLAITNTSGVDNSTTNTTESGGNVSTITSKFVVSTEAPFSVSTSKGTEIRPIDETTNAGSSQTTVTTSPSTTSFKISETIKTTMMATESESSTLKEELKTESTSTEMLKSTPELKTTTTTTTTEEYEIPEDINAKYRMLHELLKAYLQEFRREVNPEKVKLMRENFRKILNFYRENFTNAVDIMMNP